jgi:predicted RNA-binding protein
LCLLKAYIEDRDGRRFVAKDVAFVTVNGGAVYLRDIGFNSLACIEGFTSIEIDALGARLTVKRI